MNLDDAIIGGSVFLIEDTSGRRPLIRGRIDMSSARIGGQFLIRNATIEEPRVTPAGSGYAATRLNGTALSAPRLSVGAEMSMEGTCTVTGGMDLSMADMSSLFIGRGCSVQARGRTALDLTNSDFRSSLTVDERVAVEGIVRLAGAYVHGKLSLDGAVLSGAGDIPGFPGMRTLLAAEGLKVDGDVLLRNLRATGGALRFRNAVLGGMVIASGARLTNPGGYTLNLHQATVKGSVRLDQGFESRGMVVLNRAAIEGRLECGEVHSLAVDSDQTVGEITRSRLSRRLCREAWTSAGHRSHQASSFTNAATAFLADDPRNWPSRIAISGFTYDRFEHPQGSTSGQIWDRAARCAWLTRQAVYDSGPFEQAARVFRQHGYISEAEQILIAQRRQARQAAGRPGLMRRAVDATYDVSVGYGYRPGRVLWLLAALLALAVCSLEIPANQATLRATTSAGAVYTTTGPLQTGRLAAAESARKDSCSDGRIRCFNPVLYAIDTVLPLVSLDQRSVWYPDPHVRFGTLMQWWLNFATLLGWVLSTIFVLSLARLARNA